MREQFDNKLAQSVVEWLNNTICNDGGGFVNTGSLLYLQEDSTRSDYKSYSSPWRSWIYDSCVEGANIPSGFYNSNGQFLTRDSGLFIDFQNGRVLSSGNLGATISGSYSRREYNVQFTSNEVAALYIERVFQSNPDIDYTKTGAYPYSYTAPIIFVTNSSANNEPFELGGGLKQKKRFYKLYAITRSNFSNEALASVLTEKTNTYIPIINSQETPLNFYGDIKNGHFNYCDLKTPERCGSGAYLENIYHYKINFQSNKTSTWFASAYDLELNTIQ